MTTKDFDHLQNRIQMLRRARHVELAVDLMVFGSLSAGMAIVFLSLVVR